MLRPMQVDNPQFLLSLEGTGEVSQLLTGLLLIISYQYRGIAHAAP